MLEIEVKNSKKSALETVNELEKFIKEKLNVKDFVKQLHGIEKYINNEK